MNHQMMDSPPDLIGLDRYVTDAVALLGWDEGTTLGPIRLMARRVFVVAQLFPAVHQYRQETGWPPVEDKTTIETWTWPENRQRAPQPAVLVRGVLAPARYWGTARFAAAPFFDMGPVAVLVPRSQRPCVPDGYYLGKLGVVLGADHGVDVLRGAGGQPTLQVRSVAHRVALEGIYARLLRDQGGEQQ